MKIIFMLFLSLFANLSWAQKTGVGVILGNPSGLSAKHWLGETTAIDGGFGISLGKHAEASLHSDYLFHEMSALYFNDQTPLDLYFGLGGRMEFADDIELGLRVPVGVAHMMENQQADMFLEVAPVLDFVGKTGLELNLGIGARYYFN